MTYVLVDIGKKDFYSMSYKTSINKNKSGQGLLETIVAIGIIVSGVVGMMNLTISNQSASEDAEERLIAINLSREGIEVVRNIRDTNWLSCEIVNSVLDCNNWDKSIVSGIDVIAVPIFNVDLNLWTIDFTADAISHDHARVWRKNAGNAEFIGAQFQSADATPANSTLTAYRRILELYSICSDKAPVTSCAVGDKIGIRVQSRVYWESRGKINEVITEERLFNWR
ncbi:hypothetical protein KKF64_00650 [Patescibacteria group bacterium]|nr:hypothetical protein [Patescibacteria group bacterium]